jgi:DnaK suppressor protein
MEPDDLENLRAKLLERRAELMAEGDLEIEPVKRDPSEKVDEDAAPLAEMSQVIASRRNKTRALELQRINGALQRMEEDPDDFGYCDDCGDPIPTKRLELIPWARRCVACQEDRSPTRGGRRRHLTDYND